MSRATRTDTSPSTSTSTGRRGALTAAAESSTAAVPRDRPARKRTARAPAQTALDAGPRARLPCVEVDLALLERTLALRGEPAYRMTQVWDRNRRRRARLRVDDDAAHGAAARARGRCSLLDARARARVAGARRHGQGAAPNGRRPSGRGGAHALPGRSPLDLPVGPVRLPAHLHVLRDRTHALRAQPDRVRDPRPGAPLPPPRAARPLRLHGDGRADDEPRRRARGVPAPPRPRRHAPAHRDLDGRLAPGARALHGDRPARAARALAARARRRAALATHAGERPLPARRRARRLRAPTTSAAGARSSSST